MIYLIMGVLGSGKTTIGKKLAKRLKCVFCDGDYYHSKSSKAKMRKGIPLTDKDRRSWLFAIRSVIDLDLACEWNSVVACSALKEKYRKVLIGPRKNIKLIYLKGTPEIIKQRIRKRRGHFANPSLLANQFETLEEPKDALVIDIRMPPDEIVDKIIAEAK